MADINIDEGFDFGFTTTSAQDITHPQTQNKVQQMYNAIIPLLNNLSKDSETNEYIYWPNRADKILQFKKKLDSILNS